MNGAVIADVYPGTIAESLGLSPGDRILKINGAEPLDLIRFQWEWAEEEVSIEVSGEAGYRRYSVTKANEESLGVRFEQAVFDGVRRCGNRCLFCFVDQTPPGCRESLYIRDDDYRLSFLQGAFITLTNLSGEDIRRIIRERLSPLYISVHATDPGVRARLLGRSGPDRSLEALRRLSDAGINYHCQVVLCPGINDGEVLKRTVRELGELEGALSLAVVPVGLTGHRQGLADLRRVSKEEAGALIRWHAPVQQEFLAAKGTRFIWLSDELYILAGADIPEAEYYEDYPQWENGVGLVRGLLDEADGYKLPEALAQNHTIRLAGGISAMQALAPLWERLRKIKGLRLELLPLQNRFFGPEVNVSGLLTGKCLREGLKAMNLPPGAKVYLPDIMRRSGEGRFLDGALPDEVAEGLGLRFVFLPQDGGQMLELLMEDLGDML